MSCKIIEAADAGGVKPIEWVNTAVPSSATPAPLYFKEEAKRQEPSIEQKIRELEAAAEQRIREAQARGRQEGESAAAQQFQSRVDQLGAILQGVAGLRARLRRESEEDLVKLAVAIARRILRRELSVDSEALSGVVKACLEKMDARQVQRLRLHPSAADLLRPRLAGSIEVLSDSQCAPGDILLEGPQGDIDAGIDTQLAEIERGFADMLPQRSRT